MIIYFLFILFLLLLRLLVSYMILDRHGVSIWSYSRSVIVVAVWWALMMITHCILVHRQLNERLQVEFRPPSILMDFA